MDELEETIDELEEIINEQFKNDPDKLSYLKNSRGEIFKLITEYWDTNLGKLTPEEFVNGYLEFFNNHFQKIAERIGLKDYRKLFEMEPNEPIKFIDRNDLMNSYKERLLEKKVK
jgi:hypothetical protein